MGGFRLPGRLGPVGGRRHLERVCMCLQPQTEIRGHVWMEEGLLREGKKEGRKVGSPVKKPAKTFLFSFIPVSQARYPKKGGRDGEEGGETFGLA